MTAIPPAVFAPQASGVDVVQVDDAVHPHAVLSRISAAGRTSGPLTVYVSGLLMLDRTKALHLALRDSTPRSIRYDGLPWEWVVQALRSRPRRDTLIIVDLATDAQSWARLCGDRSVLDGLPVWGVVNPPQKLSAGTTPFTHALSTVLSRGVPRVSADVQPADIHPAVVERANLAAETIELVPAGPGLLLRNVRPGAPPAPRPSEVAATPPLPELLPQTSDPTPYLGELTRIRSASERGDHTVAVVLAQDLDGRLTTSLGVDHLDSLAAREVHAWTSVAAGRYLPACELYRDVARRRLRVLPADDERVMGPADCAHAAWLRIPSGDDARRIGPTILALRELAPGPSGLALVAAQRYWARLQEDDPDVQMRKGPEAWSAYLGRQSRQSPRYAGPTRVSTSGSAA